MKVNKKFFIIAILLFLFYSCLPTLIQKRHKDLELPKEYTEQTELQEQSLANEVWDKFFQDKPLVNLIQISVENNRELAILEQEINIANNEILARYGEYLPKVALQSDFGIEKTERFSTPDANSPTLFAKGGLVMSWEVDIWKKLRNATKSAYLQYLASIEGRRYVVTNLISEVSSTYYEVLSLKTQIQLIKDYVEVLEKVKKIVTLLRQAGRTSSLAVQRFEAEVAKNVARQYELTQRISITENRLNLLLGRFPKPIEYNTNNFLETTLPNVQTTVPIKLLENRPDLRKASLNLEARKLDVEVARARFYPSLTIDGNLGYEAFNSKHFDGTAVDVAYKLAGGIAMPLLNRRAIEASYHTANNLQIQAIYEYELTLLKAFTEVSNQLIKLRNLKNKFEQKEKQVEALKNSVQIADTLFKAGRTDYIEVLLAQRDLIEAQIELVEIKQSQLEANLGLYKALGGGWRGQKEYLQEANWKP